MIAKNKFVNVALISNKFSERSFRKKSFSIGIEATRQRGKIYDTPKIPYRQRCNSALARIIPVGERGWPHANRSFLHLCMRRKSRLSRNHQCRVDSIPWIYDRIGKSRNCAACHGIRRTTRLTLETAGYISPQRGCSQHLPTLRASRSRDPSR
jgi:hypothetical protein